MKTSVKSKKQIALLSAGALLSLGIAATAGGLTASAATISKGGTEQGTVTVEMDAVPDAWSIEIPASIKIGEEVSVANVTASGVKIEAGKKLQVKAESAHSFTLSKDGTSDTGIKYDLKKDGTNVSNGVVLEVEAGTASGESKLSAELKAGYDNYSTGGEAYEDTLTFTVEIVNNEG